MDLLDYWIHLEGSVRENDPSATYLLAVKRGTWRGSEFVQQAVNGREQVIPPADLADVPTHDPADLIEERYEDELSQRVARQLVSELDDEKFAWLKGYLAGLSSREEAAATHTPQRTVSDRRRRAINALRLAAKSEGLIEA